MYLERKILARFDRISTISHSMYNFALGKNLKKEKLILFPNWVDTKLIINQKSEKDQENPYLKELNIKKSDLVIMYSGTMSEKQGLKILPTIIKHFKKVTDIYWLLAGEGPFKDYLVEKLRDQENTKILPLQPKEKFNDWINLCSLYSFKTI